MERGPDRVRLQLAVKFLISNITNFLLLYSNSLTASTAAPAPIRFFSRIIYFSRALYILLCPTFSVVSTQILQSCTLLNCHLFVFR